MLKKVLWLSASFLSFLTLPRAQGQAPAYHRQILELDRYFHVKNFTLTYPAFTDLQIQNLLEGEELVQISCNKDVTFINGKKTTVAHEFSGKIYSPVNAQKLLVRFDQQGAHCYLESMGYKIRIESESFAHAAVANLRKGVDACRTPDASPLLHGCHENAGSVEILGAPYEALNARFKMLMGYDLSYADYLKKDPNMFLDFSKAPVLDLVIFDTLQIMKDFVGTLHVRMLEHHLRQGAQVHVVTSKVLLFPREKGWIYELRRKFPEIHFHIYEKSADKISLKESIHSIHRTSHVKVLLTYSHSQPQHNAFIAGGRNAAEMYFYPQMPDNSAYPDIIQWNKEPNYGWVYFNDLDFKVSGTALTETLARSILAYNAGLPWDNSQTLASTFTNKNVSFFLSTPYGESKGQLEDVYVNLFSSAKKSLHIFSPYINFTQPIALALEHARQRGVDIKITTNLSVEGDLLPGMLQPTMNKSIRQVIKSYKIDYFSIPEQIYHAKAIIVDDAQILLGSINMNRRSFLHDTEIAFLFKDPQVLKDFKLQFARDIAPHVHTLTPEQIPRASLMELLVSPLISFF